MKYQNILGTVKFPPVNPWPKAVSAPEMLNEARYKLAHTRKLVVLLSVINVLLIVNQWLTGLPQ